MFQNLLTANVKINYDRNKILGHGTYGSVFEGKFEGKAVAVKRTPLIHVIDLVTKDEYLMSISHPNLVMLFYIARDEDFRFAVMELCAASLDRLFEEDPKKYNGPIPTNVQVLLQLANGLGYLHSLNIMHGEIKPENILISSTSPVQMKWTGFGFTQSKKDSYSMSQSATRMGSRKWWAPEMYKDEDNVTEKGEIFSTGCVFLYFISGGLHPFATSHLGEFDIAVNVTMGYIINEIDLSIDNLGFVGNMIKTNPEERILLHDVINELESLQRSNLIIPYQSLQYEEKSYLNGKYSCGLFLSRPEKVVVKRIPTNYCSTNSYDELKKCNISNIVRTLNIGNIGTNTFLHNELCEASLDQLFLPEEDAKKYKGPMPSHEQVFFQLVTGLQFIHGKGLVHGSIKPSNILISSSQDPQIKLSEFGFTLPRWNKSSSTFSDFGFLSDNYWIAPELIPAFKVAERKDFNTVFKPTTKSDVFAAGKVFFYYLGQFYANIIPKFNLTNASSENEKNIFKRLPMMGYCKIQSEHFPIHMIGKMSEKEPDSRLQLSTVIDRIISYQLTSKGELKGPKTPTQGNSIQTRMKFSRDHILGKGGQAVVHLGVWEGTIVAVKRISTRSHKVTKELKLQKLSHCNIVKFFGSEMDNDFMYIAMEKCLVSLNSYCRQPQLYLGIVPMPSDQQVLLQMAEGLEYIHSQNLIHRDVKPGNILISADNPAVIKWTDFGLAKYIIIKKEIVSEEASSNKDEVNWVFPQGTEGWMAPEVISKGGIFKDGDTSKKSDIFCLGCVFFFFLFSAAHPFGNNTVDRRMNIMAGNPTNFKKYSKRNPQFSTIINEMIKLNLSERTEISVVIERLKTFDEISEVIDALSSQLSLGNTFSFDPEPDIKRRKKK